MNFDFDKEMDFWLREQSRRDVSASNEAGENHLEADDLAAFAENAVPENTRSLYVEHLADCRDCRRILIDLIRLQEAEQEESAAVTTKINQPNRKFSWAKTWRSLAAFPKIGLAAATLLILLVGASAVVVLQKNSGRSVAQMTPIVVPPIEPRRVKQRSHSDNDEPDEEEIAPAAEETPQIAETPTPTPERTPNIFDNATPTPEATPAGLPPSMRVVKNLTGNTRANNQPESTVAAAPRSANVNANVNSNSGAANAPVARKPAPNTNPGQRAPETTAQNPQITRPFANRQSNTNDTAPPIPTRANPVGTSAPNFSEIETVNGKTFQKISNVWKDKDFGGQPAKSVARGSDEYKKLDAGLQKIAERLSGTIFVVWQGKAYRIQ